MKMTNKKSKWMDEIRVQECGNEVANNWILGASDTKDVEVFNNQIRIMEAACIKFMAHIVGNHVLQDPGTDLTYQLAKISNKIEERALSFIESCREGNADKIGPWAGEAEEK